MGNIIYNSDKPKTYYCIISLVEHQGTIKICSLYPKIVLTGVIKYLKGFEGDRNSVRINGISIKETILHVTVE